MVRGDISHTPGGREVIIGKPGVYEATVHIQPGSSFETALMLNGTPIGGGSFSGFSAGTPFEASVIFEAKAGDVLTLRNFSQANRMIIPKTTCGNLCATCLALSIKKIGE